MKTLCCLFLVWARETSGHNLKFLGCVNVKKHNEMIIKLNLEKKFTSLLLMHFSKKSAKEFALFQVASAK